MSGSVQPHRRQPTRLPRPWDSPGKNSGMGCHFLLQNKKVKSESEVGQSCPTLSDPMDCSLLGSSVHGILQARVLEWGSIDFSIFPFESLLNTGLAKRSIQVFHKWKILDKLFGQPSVYQCTTGYNNSYWQKELVITSVNDNKRTWGAYIFLGLCLCFLWINTQKWSCWIIC